jgi:hypothetical protein
VLIQLDHSPAFRAKPAWCLSHNQSSPRTAPAKAPETQTLWFGGCFPRSTAGNVRLVAGELRARVAFCDCPAASPAGGGEISGKTYRFSKARNLTPPECDIGFKCGRKSIAGLRADREDNLRRVIRSDPRFSGSAGRWFSIDVASHPRQRQTVRKGGTQSCGSVPVGIDSRAAEWVMQAARASTGRAVTSQIGCRGRGDVLFVANSYRSV